MKRIYLLFTLVIFTLSGVYATSDEQRGMYFDKKVYTPSELPSFEEVREALPSPIWDENPEWVSLPHCSSHCFFNRRNASAVSVVVPDLEMLITPNFLP